MSAASAPRTSNVNPGLRSSWTRPLEPVSTALQKKSVAPVPNSAARRDRVALVPPALGPHERLGPLRLQVRAGGAVEERLLQLTPAPFVGDPRERGPGRVRVARDRRHGRAELGVRAASVVAADPGLGRAAQVQGVGELVGMRAGSRIDDRVRPVDDPELVVAPFRALGALVRAVADQRPGPRRSRRGRRRRRS